jgi:putative transposase
LYQERHVTPRRANDATRLILAGLSRFLEWRQLVVIVKPEMLIRWHRQGFRQFWHWTSRAPGRPPIPADVQRLIATMAAANRTWGEERIANELLVKLGIRVTADGAAVHAVATTAPETRYPSVEHIRGESRTVRARDS